MLNISEVVVPAAPVARSHSIDVARSKSDDRTAAPRSAAPQTGDQMETATATRAATRNSSPRKYGTKDDVRWRVNNVAVAERDGKRTVRCDIVLDRESKYVRIPIALDSLDQVDAMARSLAAIPPQELKAATAPLFKLSTRRDDLRGRELDLRDESDVNALSLIGGAAAQLVAPVVASVLSVAAVTTLSLLGVGVLFVTGGLAIGIAAGQGRATFLGKRSMAERVRSFIRGAAGLVAIFTPPVALGVLLCDGVVEASQALGGKYRRRGAAKAGLREEISAKNAEIRDGKEEFREWLRAR